MNSNQGLLLLGALLQKIVNDGVTLFVSNVWHTCTFLVLKKCTNWIQRLNTPKWIELIYRHLSFLLELISATLICLVIATKCREIKITYLTA